MEKITDILNNTIKLGGQAEISILSILLLLGIFLITALLLKIIRRIATRKLPTSDQLKFITVYNYIKYFVFLIVILVTLDNIGVNVTGIIAGAAALLIGIGLALQTFFQDIISGIFILMDQSVHVDDIIELEGKVGRVTSINLRTTKAVTIENKVLIIPNHLYLTNTLYNWTQNEKSTREWINVGVAYGSDVQLVKMLLLKAAESVPSILKQPEPNVFFSEFGDSSLNFKLVVTIENSFLAIFPKSDLHFEIDKLFREHNVKIPFPQRDIHIINT